MFNDTKMPFPLTVQLCDKLENPSDEPNVKVVLNTDRGIKVRISVFVIQLNFDQSLIVWSPFNKCSFSRTSTNDHLSTTATFLVPEDNPYINSCLNLSTTATATKACFQVPK